MLGVIAVVTVIVVPVLFRETCRACGRHNALDLARCAGCGACLPADDGQAP
jgi:hypothetical protein